MSKRKCARCGKDPADGFASIYQDGEEQWFCHDDEGESCYIAESLDDEVLL